MLKILSVFGTRPETIKMAPVIKELAKHSHGVTNKVCLTGQHREMLDPLLDIFDIKPDYNLDIMLKDQSLEYITGTVLMKMEEVISRENPDYLIVQGDTTTSMAAALAAYYQKVKVAHVEAGLRTGDMYNPYPEEVNRKIIDSVCDLYFPHTESAKTTLEKEGVKKEKIEVTGNTVIDSLLDIAAQPFDATGTPLEGILKSKKKIILVTAHRRESFGPRFENICQAIKTIAEQYSSSVSIVYPVHLNPQVQHYADSILKGVENISLIKPLDYDAFVHLMKASYFILSDSGGIQEEAPSLNKPVIVLRNETERPEALETGATRLAGTDTRKIVEETVKLMEDQKEYQAMAKAANPYGDGKAAVRIVDRLLREGKNNA